MADTQILQILSNPAVILFITIWSLLWKGWALWIASHKESKPWFVALLVLNTMGIVEILYIFVFSKNDSYKKLVKKFRR